MTKEDHIIQVTIYAEMYGELVVVQANHHMEADKAREFLEHKMQHRLLLVKEFFTQIIDKFVLYTLVFQLQSQVEDEVMTV